MSSDASAIKDGQRNMWMGLPEVTSPDRRVSQAFQGSRGLIA